MKLKRLSFLLPVALLFALCLSLPTQAQAQAPTPTPTPTPSWYFVRINVDNVDISNEYKETITNASCSLVPYSDNGVSGMEWRCTHTASGWGRYHNLYTLPSPEDNGLVWGFRNYSNEGARPDNSIAILVMNGWSDHGHRMDNVGLGSILTRVSQNYETTSNAFSTNTLQCFHYSGGTAPEIPVAATDALLAATGATCLHSRQLNTNSALPPNDANLFSWGWRANTTGARTHGVRYFGYLVYGTPPPPPPPPPPPAPPIGNWCYVRIDNGTVLTATTSITAAQSITSTATSYTLQSNLIKNGDFESSNDGVVPTGWQWSQPFAAGGMWVNGGSESGRIIRRNGSGVPVPLDLPEAEPDTLEAAVSGTSIEIVQRVIMATSPQYRLSADFLVEGDGVMVAVGTGQIAPTGTITSWATISTTTTISAGVRDVRLIFDETANTVALDNIKLIPLDADGNVNCMAIAQSFVEGGGGSGGGGGTAPPFLGGGVFWGVPLGTCLICARPTWEWTGAAMQIEEYVIFFIYRLINYFFQLGQWIRCGLLNVWTCYLWPLLYSIYNTLLYLYAGLIDAINMTAGWLQSVIDGAYNATMTLVGWFVDLYVGARNVWGMLIDWIIWSVVSMAQFAVDLAAAAVQWSVSILYYALQGGQGLAALLMLLLGTLWGGVLYLLGLFWELGAILSAVAMVLFEVVTAVGTAVATPPEGLEEWAANTDINSVAMAMFFLGISFVDWSLAELSLISAIWLVIGGRGLYIALKVIKEWEVILPN